MSQIFMGQTALRIECKTNVVITGALEQRIYWMKPEGTSGFWAAEVEGSGTSGVIYHDIGSSTSSSAALGTTGVWIFWSYVEFSDGRVAHGEPKQERIYKPGETARV